MTVHEIQNRFYGPLRSSWRWARGRAEGDILIAMFDACKGLKMLS